MNWSFISILYQLKLSRNRLVFKNMLRFPSFPLLPQSSYLTRFYVSCSCLDISLPTFDTVHLQPQLPVSCLATFQLPMVYPDHWGGVTVNVHWGKSDSDASLLTMTCYDFKALWSCSVTWYNCIQPKQSSLVCTWHHTHKHANTHIHIHTHTNPCPSVMAPPSYLVHIALTTTATVFANRPLI